MNLEVVNESKDVAVTPDRFTALIDAAVNKGLDVGSIEALIDLKNREEDRLRKMDFDERFIELKKALPIITKKNAAKNKSGDTMYKYAKLEELQRACDNIISQFGFTYYWSEEAIENGKRVIMTISGFGHERKTYFDVPLGQSNQMKNNIQVAGEMSTYGKRYTFIAGFSLTVEGEDSDAQLTFESVAEYAEEALSIKACSDLDSLVNAWQIAHAQHKGDEKALASLRAIYTAKKKELQNDSEV